jgi:predicted GH43/DUF377 family glycosyl hydrolase
MAMVGAVALLVAGCAGAESGDDSASPSTSSVAATPSVTSSPSVTGSSSVTALQGEPVLGPADVEKFVNPGGVVHHEGMFHMLRNSFTAYPGSSSTTYLTSQDGLRWDAVAEEPVLSTTDVPFVDRGTIVFPMSLLVDGETWVAYFYTFSGADRPGSIGRATAPDAAGPWAVDPEPVIEPGPAGAWDGLRVAEPSVVRTDDGWMMWYVGFDDDEVERIGLATSADGVTWERTDGPVLEGSADWDGGEIGGPQVVATDEGFFMVYDKAVLGEYGLGFATSPDGESWTPSDGNPQLTTDDTPTPQFFQAELVESPGGLLFLLEVGTGAGGTDIHAYDVTMTT